MDARSSEAVIRDLDAILQEWQQVHQRSTAAASTLLNLQTQASKTQQHQPANHALLAIQHDEIERCIRDIRRDLHGYARAVAKLDALELPTTCTDDAMMAVAGLVPEFVSRVVGDRKNAYGMEYARRRRLVREMRAGWAEEWLVSLVDYRIEEEYLDRIKCLALGRQWLANKTALEDLEKRQ
ncbi:hypothetical protein LPJ56_000950 [Coemansia sp. RSA 2599]|nr:hypothetical protein LPJ75_000264 [Coemansia sp. RSA 2598]KAJ1828687.1 hypothetical protein LPJ56_000950 [Coemansia sp. RSA 2599]